MSEAMTATEVKVNQERLFDKMNSMISTASGDLIYMKKFWDIFKNCEFMTGAWIGLEWDELPQETKDEFSEIIDLFRNEDEQLKTGHGFCDNTGDAV